MSTLNSNPIAKAVRTVLLAGTAAALAMPAAYAAEDEEGEKVTITGSRIKRTDVEGSLPVTVIDREQIEMSGDTNVADLLRNTSFNSFGSIRPQSGNSAQSVAELSLRGLGGGRTLILIDGRRLPKSANTGSIANLNAVPLAAVERIEILSDGASSVYGSDAIGGVVNIITRKDFDGVEVKLGASEPSREGGKTEEYSFVIGAAGDKGSLMAGAAVNRRDIVFARDREWSQTGLSTYGANFYDVAINPDTGAAEEGTFIDGNSATCDSHELFVEDADGTFCRFNFAAISADEADVANNSMFFRGQYEVNADTVLFMNGSVSRIKSFGRYAPSLASLLLDASSPNNPYAQDVFLRHRFAGLGPRDTFIEDVTYDFEFGGNTYISEGMELEYGYRNTENKYDEFGYNYVVIPLAQRFLNDGTYDLNDPYGNDANTLSSMKATISRNGKTKYEEMFSSLSFDLFDMDGGTAQMVVGAEYRDIAYQDQYDSLSEAGVIGGSAGNSAGGTRDVKSAYFETLMPLTTEFELNIAGRYESYSDYGNDFAPKVSVRYQPMDELTLRASFGQGFRAPTLDLITAKTAFSADSVSDPQNCAANNLPADCNLQINAYRIANPNLESEESDQFAFGVAYAPLDNFSMTLDYYSIEISNRIKFFSTGTLLTNEAQGIPNPPGLGVTRLPNGAITRVDTGYGNEGTVETDGVDLNFKSKFEFGDFVIDNNIQLGYVNSYKIEGVESVGGTAAPESRGVITTVASMGDMSLAWNLNYISGWTEDRLTSYVPFGYSDNVPSWITHDLQFNYELPSDTRLTLGVNNVADKDPNLNLFELRGYVETLYDGYGRNIYARITQNF